MPVRCRQYFANGIDLKTILPLEKPYALTRPASPITNAAPAVVEVLVERAPSNSAVPDDEKYWTMSDLVEADAEVQVGVKRCLRDLQEWCRVKRRNVPESIVEAVGLGVELVGDTVVAPPDTVVVANPRTDELSE